MRFDSLTFLCLFLPLTLLAYWLLPVRLRNGCLLICSLLFLALGDPWYAPVLVISAIADFFLANALAGTDNPGKRRGILIGGVIKDGVLLLLVKQYVGMPEVYYSAYPVLSLLVPLGLILYALKSVSYLADVYNNAAPRQERLVPLLLYFFFYPALPFGPAIRYRDFSSQLAPDARTLTKGSLLDALWSVSKGAFKVVVLYRHYETLWDTISGGISASTTLFTSLGALLCGCFGLCFLWSGMQDFAKGLAGLYGFSFRKSDDYPLMARGMSDFLRRLDRNLFLWLQTYAYAPSVTAGNPSIRWIVNVILFFVFRSFFAGDFLTLGVWLGGLCLYLLMDRLLFLHLLSKAWKWLQHTYTWVMVLFCALLFLLPDMKELAAFLASLVRLSPLATLDALLESFSKTLLILLAVGFPLSVSFSPQRLARRLLYRDGKKTPWLLLPASLLLLMITLMFCM